MNNEDNSYPVVKLFQRSDTPRSVVWLGPDGFVYKRQCKHLTQNEIQSLTALYPSGFVPWAEQIDDETIKMEYIKFSVVTSWRDFKMNALVFLTAMKNCGLRHGDLTKYAIIPVEENTFKVIDWATSRVACDPRPSKRPGTDAEWLDSAIEEMRKDAGS